MFYIDNKRYQITPIYPDTDLDFDASFKVLTYMKNFSTRQCVSGMLAIACVGVAGIVFESPIFIGAGVLSTYGYYLFVRECNRLNEYSIDTKKLFDFETQYNIYQHTEKINKTVQHLEKLKRLAKSDVLAKKLEVRQKQSIEDFFKYLLVYSDSIIENKKKYLSNIDDVNSLYYDKEIDPLDFDNLREANIDMSLRCDRDIAYISKVLAKNLDLFADLCPDSKDILKMYMKIYCLESRIEMHLNKPENFTYDEDKRLRKVDRIKENYKLDYHGPFSDNIKREDFDKLTNPTIEKAEKFLNEINK